MLKPDKHTNPVLSVVNIAGLIIKEIKNDGIVSYNDLLASLKNQTSDSAKNVFHYCLSFANRKPIMWLLKSLSFVMRFAERQNFEGYSQHPPL